MKFWDASALVPLLVAEEKTPALQGLHRRDPAMLVWWGTEIECASALSRVERQGSLSSQAAKEGLARLDALSRAWAEVQPTEVVRGAARRMLRVHPLRAADALQLAAAIVASEGQPSSLQIVSLDDRLSDAAQREGLIVTEV